jgi:hypothetical protein
MLRRRRKGEVKKAIRLRLYGEGYRLLGVEATADFHALIVAQAHLEHRPIASLCRRALAAYLQTAEALRAAGKLPIPRPAPPPDVPADWVEI